MDYEKILLYFFYLKTFDALKVKAYILKFQAVSAPADSRLSPRVITD